MLKKSIALLIAVFALIPLAFAGGISVDIYAPENASYGEPIQITFLVTNNAGVSSNVSITEQVELEDIASQKENLVIPEVQFDTIAYQPPYLSWNLNMQPGETKNVSYLAKPGGQGITLWLRR